MKSVGDCIRTGPRVEDVRSPKLARTMQAAAALYRRYVVEPGLERADRILREADMTAAERVGEHQPVRTAEMRAAWAEFVKSAALSDKGTRRPRYDCLGVRPVVANGRATGCVRTLTADPR